MNLLLDPNVAYLLLLAGLLFGLLALVTPGTGLLEAAALFCLAVAAYSVTQLDVNLWALVLMFLSIAPFIFAIRRPKGELFLAITIISLVIGSVFLFRNADGGPAVNLAVAGLASIFFAVFLWFIIRKYLQVIRENPARDLDSVVGVIGKAKTAIFEEGSVQLPGELWSARSENPISAGTPVRVVRREGFILVVEKINLSQSN